MNSWRSQGNYSRHVAKYGSWRSKSSVPKVNQCFFCLGKHTEITCHGWLPAALRMYLWWEMQMKMSVDQEHFTRRTMPKGLGDIGSSPLWRWGAEILWIGPFGKCSPPSGCKGLDKPSHDAKCSQLCCVGASMLVNELYTVVDGVVCVTLRFAIAVRTRAITDDRSAGFDPCIYNGHQSVGYVLNGNEKHFSGF